MGSAVRTWSDTIAKDALSIADYCESDVVNRYRVWLRHELFRGRRSAAEFEASERGAG